MKLCPTLKIKAYKVMKRMYLFPIIILLSSGLLGCQDNEDFSLNQIDIEVLTMVDETEQNAFDVGTDIILALKVTNNSGRDFEWYYEYECVLSTQQDFLLVKKEVLTEGSNLSSIPVGTPYQFPLNCPTINLPPRHVIPSGNEKIVVAYPWSSNPDNAELQPGKYFSKFIITIAIEGHQRSWDLRTDFIIQ
jgi:hypothetical protein